jgi:hypothetical protein
MKKTYSEYSLIRGRDSGVFFGIIKERNGQEIVIEDCRRIWYWSGAASCSQLAIDGVSDPDNCKFPESEELKIIFDAIEISPITAEALASLKGVHVWGK